MSYYIPLFGTWISNNLVENCPSCHSRLNKRDCIKPKPHIRFQVCGFCFKCQRHYWTLS